MEYGLDNRAHNFFCSEYNTCLFAKNTTVLNSVRSFRWLVCSNIFLECIKNSILSGGWNKREPHKAINNKRMDRNTYTRTRTQNDCDDRTSQIKKMWQFMETKVQQECTAHTEIQTVYVMCSPNKSPVIYWQWHKHILYVLGFCIMRTRNLHART